MDQSKREIERRAALDGVEGRARLLQARLREGSLSEEQLHTAGWFGDVAILVAKGEASAEELLHLNSLRAWLDQFRPGWEDVEDPPFRRDPLIAWLILLRTGSRALLTRISVVAARLVLPIWEAEYPDDRRPQRALAAAETWVLDQTDEALAEASLAASQAKEASRVRGQPAGAALVAAQAAQGVMQPAGAGEDWAYAQAKLTLTNAASTLGTPGDLAPSDPVPGSPRSPHDLLWRAVGAELTPWILGESDPVADRRS